MSLFPLLRSGTSREFRAYAAVGSLISHENVHASALNITTTSALPDVLKVSVTKAPFNHDV